MSFADMTKPIALNKPTRAVPVHLGAVTFEAQRVVAVGPHLAPVAEPRSTCQTFLTKLSPPTSLTM